MASGRCRHGATGGGQQPAERGPWRATAGRLVLSFAIGTLCLGVVAAFSADWSGMAGSLGQQPWWRWLGGVIGAGFVYTAVFLAPRIGITSVMFLFIIGQLLAGMFIDGFGLIQMPVRPLHWWKFVGLGVMLLGLACFMFGDRVFGDG